MCGHSMSQNASASLKMTIPSKDDGESGSKPLPAVPPWGGSTIYNEKVVRLRNTCTIDNFVTMFHFICLSNPSIQSQRDLFYSRIIEVHKLFEAGDFALGKLHWLELLPQKVDLTHTVIDIFGNEFEYFISAMTDVVATVKTNFCSDSKCPKPTISSTSSEIILDVDKTQKVRNKMSSVHLFPCGCTTRLLHFAYANIIPSVQHAKFQGPILCVVSSKEYQW